MTTPKLSPLAIHRLKQVRQQILDKPETFNHASVGCGTVCCIAGHLCKNDGVGWNKEGAGDAADLLGMTSEDCWPPFFAPRMITDASTHMKACGWSVSIQERALAGARIIDAFIAKYS